MPLALAEAPAPISSKARAEVFRKNAEAAFVAGFVRGITPLPRMSVSRWADEYLRLTTEQAAEHGKYRTDRLPYLREIMDNLGPESPVNEIVIMKGAQVGCTTLGVALAGHTMHLNPMPMGVYMPREADALDYSKRRFKPSMDDNPMLRDLLRKGRSKSTVLTKYFPGGSLKIFNAETAASFRQATLGIIIADELDAWPSDIEGEGDGYTLLKKRATTYGSRRKLIALSTPTVEGYSLIHRLFGESDKRRYHVPCPSCNHMQHLTWGQIKFKKDDRLRLTSEPVYECRACGHMIEEKHKLKMLHAGEWRAEEPHYRLGYHIPQMLQPMISWAEIVNEFLESRRTHSREKLKTWTNTCLGEAFRESDDTIDSRSLLSRREVYRAEVPMGACVLVAGVDVQRSPARLECEVIAFGPGYESWGIERFVIPGEARDKTTWDTLFDYLSKDYQHESGATLRIHCMAIDSGDQTDVVYRHSRDPKRGAVYPRVSVVKGSNQAGAPPISAPRKNKQVKALYAVGTDTIKDTWAAHLQVTEPGPCYCHFPANYTDEFFDQITSESPRYKMGKRIWETRVPGTRNEALDCRVYAYAALLIRKPASLENWHASLLASAPKGDSEPGSPQGQSKPQPQPRRQRKSWANDWR